MASVTGASESRVSALEASAIKSAGIDANGHLQLTRQDNSTIDGGSFQAPTGCVQMFAGSVMPAGWLLCNGQALNRTTYAALFAVVGTAYGAGDGSTTFNVPNMELSFPRQQAAARGAVGGSATHQHTLPTHTHAAHQHGLGGGSPVGYAQADFVTGPAPNVIVNRVTGISATWTGDVDAPISGIATNTDSGRARGIALAGNTGNGGGSTVNTGGSPTDAASTLPPYVNLNFIIKA